MHASRVRSIARHRLYRELVKCFDDMFIRKVRGQRDRYEPGQPGRPHGDAILEMTGGQEGDPITLRQPMVCKPVANSLHKRVDVIEAEQASVRTMQDFGGCITNRQRFPQCTEGVPALWLQRSIVALQLCHCLGDLFDLQDVVCDELPGCRNKCII